jgi:lipopolysaccharide transport system ATP-binding protein
MSDVAIHTENLGKLYHIGQREPYDTLRDAITRTLVPSFRRVQGEGNRDADTNSLRARSLAPNRIRSKSIWALKDVSFDVKQGEVVGVIGRNGAGKSTLLKILSRITEPSEGHARIRGRAGSLLEVGTGFHPELTGRENIYLNGAILGMKKKEIDRKFDEIVEFAEIETFLDTPVKRYSSGMYMRLAFSVAAHLEPQVLLVDEVLAIGDAAFQRKCLGKMNAVGREGRTVLFVSHNMAAVLNLCPRSILMDRGKVLEYGATGVIVDQYLQSASVRSGQLLRYRNDRTGNRRLTITSFQLLNVAGEPIAQAVSGEDVQLAFRYSTEEKTELRNVHMAIGVHGRYDENLFHLSTRVSAADFEAVPPEGVFTCRICRLPLQPGNYSFNIFCKVGGEIADWVQNAGVIDVAPGDFFNSGNLPPLEQGSFLLPHSWNILPRSHMNLT